MKSSEGFTPSQIETEKVETKESIDVEIKKDISDEQFEQYAINAEADVDRQATEFLPKTEQKIETFAGSINVPSETMQAARKEQGLDGQLNILQSEADQFANEAKSNIKAIIQETQQEASLSVESMDSEKEIEPDNGKLEKQKQAELLQKELVRIREEAIIDGKLFYNDKGEFEHAVAPNGEISHLSEKQWLEVRSSFFKNWFGDWEEDPDRASKFIDENGEPLVLYHGTTRKFDTFSHEAPKTFDIDNVKGSFFLTSDKKFAEAEYGKFKHNLIIDTLRKFNEVFFNGKATEWGVLIDKWNDFVRSAGSERVNFQKEAPDGRGGHYNWTIVEFDGKLILPTDELEKVWDRKTPETFNEGGYEMVSWEGKEILVPKNSQPIVMELFINSRSPNYKEAIGINPQEMDNLFAQGMIEKGIYAHGQDQEHIRRDSSFSSKPETDSVVVKLSNGQFAVAIFESNHAKSARGNNGIFTRDSNNIYE